MRTPRSVGGSIPVRAALRDWAELVPCPRRERPPERAVALTKRIAVLGVP